ncbi:MAG: S16 family serine protease [Candidatus Woesearchaeota archaeon]
MNVIRIVFGLCIVLILLSPVSFAYIESGHISLLTVAEGKNATAYGGVADLYLSIKPGTGRIFIDSYPLSKIDTQITTRFAAEIACDFLDRDCSHDDFFYTIKANSALVGGPSAGAATTVLTVAMLDNQKLKDTQVVMTGTINSGNLIGPVSGIVPKTTAAADKGFSVVLVPQWDLDNETVQNLTAINITVIPVSKLEDALYYFTGKNYSKPDTALSSDKEYTTYMKEITKDLCTQYGWIENNTLILPNLSRIIEYDANTRAPLTSEDINNSIIPVNFSSSTNSTNASLVSKDQFVRAIDAIHNQEYYSAASFCFAGNVRITADMLRNVSKKKLKIAYMEVFTNISDFEKQFAVESKDITRISQLETTVIVKERLSDAKKSLTDQSYDNLSSAQVAYAKERFTTAVVWSRFMGLQGKEFVLDQGSLQIVCLKKIGEAEERTNYLELFFPTAAARDGLDEAYRYYNAEDYASCIFSASKAKADANVVLGALFVPKENINEYLDEKLSAARNVINTQSEKNIFPILGYSYYEYAQTLRKVDPYSALIYAEYSLELSNLDMYFPAKKSFTLPIDWLMISVFGAGVGFGIVLIILILLIVRRKKMYTQSVVVKNKVNRTQRKK